jgi:enamine deaminase RidA (YjgF/YER057c/UK114 family)
VIIVLEGHGSKKGEETMPTNTLIRAKGLAEPMLIEIEAIAVTR